MFFLHYMTPTPPVNVSTRCKESSLHQKFKTDNLVNPRYDKGSKVILLHKREYIFKVETFLDNDQNFSFKKYGVDIEDLTEKTLSVIPGLRSRNYLISSSSNPE